MEVALVIVQLVLVGLIWFVIKYLRGLPQQLHKVQFRSFEHDLNQRLEVFKSELVTEIERMKINESQLHIHKSREFQKISDFFGRVLTDPEYLNKVATDETARREFKKEGLNLGTGLFFFSNDATIKSFVAFRRHVLKANEPEYDEFRAVILYAELILNIRRDLGYVNTSCEIDDFMFLILSDWDKYRAQYGYTD